MQCLLQTMQKIPAESVQVECEFIRYPMILQILLLCSIANDYLAFSDRILDLHFKCSIKPCCDTTLIFMNHYASSVNINTAKILFKLLLEVGYNYITIFKYIF